MGQHQWLKVTEEGTRDLESPAATQPEETTKDAPAQPTAMASLGQLYFYAQTPS